MIRALPQRRPTRGMDVSLAIVNIVLLLIFFFLATGQLLNPDSRGVAISETTKLPLDQLPSPILVVRDSGAWELGQTPIAPENLGPAIRDLEAPLTLHVLIGRDAPADSLLQILDRPELAEAEIKLVTLRRAVTP